MVAGGSALAQSAPVPEAPWPALPPNLPSWLDNKKTNHLFRKRGDYNYDVYKIPALARDLNAVTVGHALAYEDLVTGKESRLETQTYNRINTVLKNPPKFMPDEALISPTFGRKYGVLEQVFDWTHILHDQTIDVLANTRMSNALKDAEIEKLWRFYSESVPYAITSLPMNMDMLDSQPYSKAFRKKYPKTNGLFWGYHWLQGAMYDGLYSLTPAQQKASYEVMGRRYHATELYKTDRSFMPMFSELSPRFALRFPHIANAFDNLHMLHDMVNDILATDGMSEAEKERQIKRAIWLVSAQAHQGEKPGENNSGEHDHRHLDGMPGMGMMPRSDSGTMWMDGMGWMRTAECHHCSMPLAKGENAWRSPQVWAAGTTMRVRCALCARDMSAETKGEAILRIPLESTDKTLVIFADDMGQLTTLDKDVVFIEEPASHVKCHEWSKAFSNRAAFEAWAKDKPEYKDAKLISFDEWKELYGDKPDTYEKPEAPAGMSAPEKEGEE